MILTILQPIPLSIEERTRCTSISFARGIGESEEAPVITVTANGCVDAAGRPVSPVAAAPLIIETAWEYLDRPAARVRLARSDSKEPAYLTMTTEQLVDEFSVDEIRPSTRPFDLKRDGLWRILPVLWILVVVGLVRLVRTLRSARVVILVVRS